jgi:hypothetical protein
LAVRVAQVLMERSEDELNAVMADSGEPFAIRHQLNLHAEFLGNLAELLRAVQDRLAKDGASNDRRRTMIELGRHKAA